MRLQRKNHSVTHACQPPIARGGCRCHRHDHHSHKDSRAPQRRRDGVHRPGQHRTSAVAPPSSFRPGMGGNDDGGRTTGAPQRGREDGDNGDDGTDDGTDGSGSTAAPSRRQWRSRLDGAAIAVAAVATAIPPLRPPRWRRWYRPYRRCRRSGNAAVAATHGYCRSRTVAITSVPPRCCWWRFRPGDVGGDVVEAPRRHHGCGGGGSAAAQRLQWQW